MNSRNCRKRTLASACIVISIIITPSERLGLGYLETLVLVLLRHLSDGEGV